MMSVQKTQCNKQIGTLRHTIVTVFVLNMEDLTQQVQILPQDAVASSILQVY